MRPEYTTTVALRLVNRVHLLLSQTSHRISLYMILQYSHPFVFDLGVPVCTKKSLSGLKIHVYLLGVIVHV
jgi:hypothetical protein